ncbi:MAG: bifunctional aspartate kinase/homoserine dehydrogenase I [Lutibacter sp.]
MKVLKFGGTSVSSEESINNIIKIVKSNTEPLVIVVSALSGITNQLILASELAEQKDKSYLQIFNQIINQYHKLSKKFIKGKKYQELSLKFDRIFNDLLETLEGVYKIKEITPKSLDNIVSKGELASSQMLYYILQKCKIDVGYANSAKLIKTDSQFNEAQVNFEETNKKISTYFSKNSCSVVVCSGFIASNKLNEITTLGRGGSDYSAAIYAAALQANSLEIWTDIDGMYTANPKLVKQAFSIESLTYQEAMELSHFGAKVLYPPTIQPVLKKNIPIYIRNTFNLEKKGTFISKKSSTDNSIKGISHIENISLLTLEGSGLIGVPGTAERFFGALAKSNISVSLITQASSEHSICVAIDSENEKKATKAIKQEFELEFSKEKIEDLIIDKNNAIIALVGENMKSHQGLSGKMFSTLGKNNVNIRAIAQGASEKNISAVIAKKDIKKALNTLHSSFFENQVKQLNLFVIGVGNVGASLLNQIHKQQVFLKEELNIQLKVVGLANSKKMSFNQDGIVLNNWKNNLDNGSELNLNQFHKKITDLNLRNSILVDNTASEKIANLYTKYLQKNIAVVTCNKIACSSEFNHYKKLKKLSKEYNAPFLYETNVGAGLPIIDTLKNLIISGDKIIKIQAVLSGSLNFIFNNYDGEKTFFEVVTQAGNEGYTEPDPRIDLSGIDVMRKILILARDSGYQLNLSDIENLSFLPKSCQSTKSVDNFMEELKNNESHFKKLYTQAKNKNMRLKYVAEFSNGNANVGLIEVDQNHPFYNLSGKDNVVLFFTKRYPEQPLLIKGAGAGAAVTASGLFADIIRIANY